MDRGMTSDDNLAWLRGTGRRYLIGAPRGDVRKWSHEIAEAKDGTTVWNEVEVKLSPGPDGNETFHLCRSAERREKEKAMHKRFAARIEQRLRSPADGSGREIRLRCVVRPDRAQAALLDRLGLTLPERLLIPPAVAKTQCQLDVASR